MTEPPWPSDTADPPGTLDPLDALDQVILDQVRSMYDLVDPPPADLDERVRFAIQLDSLDIEVSRLLEDAVLETGARTAAGVRTITFEAVSMTIMLTVVDPGSGRRRVEGWLAPAGALLVRLRVAGGGLYEVDADEHGRFVFDELPAGLAQLTVRRAATGETTETLVTTPVTL